MKGPIDPRYCPDCNAEMTYVSTGKTNGDLVRYFDCPACFKSWRQWREQWKEKQSGSPLQQTRNNGVIKGARVFIDGKFAGIGK